VRSNGRGPGAGAPGGARRRVGTRREGAPGDEPDRAEGAPESVGFRAKPLKTNLVTLIETGRNEIYFLHQGAKTASEMKFTSRGREGEETYKNRKEGHARRTRILENSIAPPLADAHKSRDEKTPFSIHLYVVCSDIRALHVV